MSACRTTTTFVAAARARRSELCMRTCRHGSQRETVVVPARRRPGTPEVECLGAVDPVPNLMAGLVLDLFEFRVELDDATLRIEEVREEVVAGAVSAGSPDEAPVMSAEMVAH